MESSPQRPTRLDRSSPLRKPLRKPKERPRAESLLSDSRHRQNPSPELASAAVAGTHVLCARLKNPFRRRSSRQPPSPDHSCLTRTTVRSARTPHRLTSLRSEYRSSHLRRRSGQSLHDPHYSSRSWRTEGCRPRALPHTHNNNHPYKHSARRNAL